MSRGFASNHRIVVLAGGIFLCFGVLAARLVSLHVLDRDELLKYVEQARRSFVVDNARRGNIRDARGEILAASRTLIDVGLDPHMLRPADEARWPALAQLLGVTVTDLRAAAARRTVGTPAAEEPEARPMQWIKLASEVDEGVYEKVMELKIRGIYGNRIYRRFYPHKTVAAHVIGYVNKEGAPAAGVEHYMDFFLRGQNGWRESERDGRRQERAEFRTREVPTIDGCDVVLSLDTYVQHVIEEELQHLKETYEPQKATVIVSDANTGFILGLANLPTFDLNEFNQAPLDVLRNYAVTDVLEPGSTFKIVAASGALNERLVTPNSAFDCSEAEADYHGRHLRLPRDDHPSQELTVAGIISHSSNRGAVHLGMLLGDQKMYDYARAFGFGAKTGFPFGGEVDGLLAPPKHWDGLTITRLPMGHAIAATPMQIHYAMAAIANGGVLLRPQLIRQVREANGDLVFDFADQPRRRVISEATARTMARLLMGVTSPEGTAPEAAIPDYEVAGKTGTTQKIIDGRYSERHHIASFIGFFPATRPEVVISVIVDDADARCPRGVAYGAKVAAPVFKRIAERLIQYRDIRPVADLPRARLAMQTPAAPGAGGRW